jgi:hypothetical protein
MITRATSTSSEYSRLQAVEDVAERPPRNRTASTAEHENFVLEHRAEGSHEVLLERRAER